MGWKKPTQKSPINLNSGPIQRRYDSPVPLTILLSRDVHCTMYILLLEKSDGSYSRSTFATFEKGKEGSPSTPPRECTGPCLRACCRRLPCRRPNRPIHTLVSQSQDLSTAEHPNDLSHPKMFCSVRRNLYVEVPRREDFTHHHIQEVSRTLAFQSIHPFHLGQASLLHHLQPPPSETCLA